MGALFASDEIANRLSQLRSIVEVTALRALVQPERLALTFLRDGEDDAETWNYRELWRGISRVAAQLSARNVAGGRVVLLYEPGLEYVAAFLGTMAAGAIAVPAYPPASKRMFERLRGVVDCCRPEFVLTTAGCADAFQARFSGLSDLTWIGTDELASTDYELLPIDANELAMLQYTSGSTGAPKGVMLSHGNIVANCAAVRNWLGPDPQRRGCIWLPPYHDMGLLGGLLQPLYAGFPVVFMAPLHFIQRPVRWLKAISKYRVSLSGAPNFAYALCANEISEEELAETDLACWREAFCGAEPVRPTTLQAFCDRFASYGFAQAAINPCYGLAESTLIVSGKPPWTAPLYKSFDRAELDGGRAVESHEPAGSIGLTSCGVIAGECEMRIVDTESHTELPSGQVGEIWLAGPSIAKGYWGRAEETAQVFGGRLRGHDGVFLRTGDLGFLWHDQLFVTGRCKDMIIISGKNHYPEDIERTVEAAHASIYPGSAVAFSVAFGEEEAVVIATEVRATQPGPDARAIVGKIVELVTSAHGVAPKEVLLCRRGAIARTTSGKVRRSASRNLYLAGELRQLVRP